MRDDDDGDESFIHACKCFWCLFFFITCKSKGLSKGALFCFFILLLTHSSLLSI